MRGGIVLRYQLRDVLRSRWIIGYVLLLLGLTETLFRFGGSGERVVLSLLNVVLVLLPLMSLLFGTMYLHQARRFIELMLTQPVGRRSLFLGLFGGVSLPLAGAFVLGVGVPFALRGGGYGGGAEEAAGVAVWMLLGIGLLLTVVFVGLAFLIAIRMPDRAMGLGFAITLWLFLTVIYDGAVLLGIGLFGSYPLEGPALVATLLNPIDLGRVLVLLYFDIAALMGYTGAVFSRFFGQGFGLLVAGAALIGWVAVPLALAARWFDRSDF